MLEKAEYLTMSKYNKRTPGLIKLESEVKRKTIFQNFADKKEMVNFHITQERLLLRFIIKGLLIKQIKKLC